MSSIVDPDSILQLAPRLSIELDGGALIVRRDGAVASRANLNCLAVLNAFVHPQCLRAAAQQFGKQAKGPQEFIELTSAIQAFVENGVLVPQDQLHNPPPRHANGFSADPIHIRMLNDRTRTAAFMGAIAQVVKPGDVVLDLGAGTGVLSIAAALAGAKHVYAVESGDMAHVADAMIKENGVGDRVALIRGRSTAVSLPEPADVFVGELFGIEPFEEQVLELVVDARKRLLQPKARFIPDSVELFATAVRLADGDREACHFTHELCRTWSQTYGLDFSPLATVRAQAGLLSRRDLGVARSGRCTLLSEPVRLAKVRLSTLQNTVLDATTVLTLHDTGEMDAFLLHFDLQVSLLHRISTAPGQRGPDCHWGNPTWLLPRRVKVSRGDRFELTYSYHGGIGRLAARRCVC